MVTASVIRIEIPLFLLLRSRFLRGFFSGSLFFEAYGFQSVRDAIIAFMTGMLEHRPIDLHKRQFAFPRYFPSGRIVHGEFIADRVIADTGETLDDFHVLAGPAESSLVVEICRFDNQRVSFPMPARVAEP